MSNIPARDLPLPTGRYIDSVPRVHPVLDLEVEPASNASDAIVEFQIGRFDVRRYEDETASHQFALSREVARILRDKLNRFLDG